MSDLEKILNALERLLKMFTIERYVYLALTSISFVILLWAGYQIVSTKGDDQQMLGTIFGGSGLIAIAATRMTLFFNKAFSLVEKALDGGHDAG